MLKVTFSLLDCVRQSVAAVGETDGQTVAGTVELTQKAKKAAAEMVSMHKTNE